MKIKTLVTILAATLVAPQAFADDSAAESLCTVTGAEAFLALTGIQSENAFAEDTFALNAPLVSSDESTTDILCTVTGAEAFLALDTSGDAFAESEFAMNSTAGALSDNELSEYRGAKLDNYSIINASQLANSQGNTIGDGVSSGNIYISEGAFSNNGTGNVIVNNGHGNLIQANTSVILNYITAPAVP